MRSFLLRSSYQIIRSLLQTSLQLRRSKASGHPMDYTIPTHLVIITLDSHRHRTSKLIFASNALAHANVSTLPLELSTRRHQFHHLSSQPYFQHWLNTTHHQSSILQWQTSNAITATSRILRGSTLATNNIKLSNKLFFTSSLHNNTLSSCLRHTQQTTWAKPKISVHSLFITLFCGLSEECYEPFKDASASSNFLFFCPSDEYV